MDRSKEVEVLSAMEALSNLPANKEKKPVKWTVKKKRKVKTDGVEKEVDFEYDWPICVCGINHPPVPTFKPPDGKRCTFYWQVADMFQYMTLHRILTTEIKFLEADKDNSGVIELFELRQLLRAQSNVSDKLIAKSFKQMDVDESGTLDFSEVLTVIDEIVQRSNERLPMSVKKEVAKTCDIQ